MRRRGIYNHAQRSRLSARLDRPLSTLPPTRGPRLREVAEHRAVRRRRRVVPSDDLCILPRPPSHGVRTRRWSCGLVVVRSLRLLFVGCVVPIIDRCATYSHSHVDSDPFANRVQPHVKTLVDCVSQCDSSPNPLPRESTCGCPSPSSERSSSAQDPGESP